MIDYYFMTEDKRKQIMRETELIFIKRFLKHTPRSCWGCYYMGFEYTPDYADTSSVEGRWICRLKGVLVNKYRVGSCTTYDFYRKLLEVL